MLPYARWRTAAAVAALLSSAHAAAGEPPGVVLFPALGRPTLVTVAGRVLREAPEESRTAVQENARRLAARSREKAPVEVIFAGQLRRTTSGDDGAFEVTFSAPAGRPFAAGAQVVTARVPGASANARAEIVQDEAPFLVLSDFDDTVAVSDATSARGVASTALLRDAASHPAVPGMAAFYRCLRSGGSPEPGFAFVSGSPVELAPRLEAFLARNGFPFAGLYLRHLGPATLSGYKEPVLRRLLSLFPQPVVLVGDSGERDPEVYARIRGEFPGRVKAIYIRDAGKTGRPERFEGMFLFAEAAQAARDAGRRGLASAACVAEAFPAPAADAGPKPP